MRGLICLAVLCLIGTPSVASTEMPVLDMTLLPKTAGEAALASYREQFLLGNLPRAFALASGGHYGAAWQQRTVEQAREVALDSCAKKGGTDCRVYAENLDIVWPGRPPGHPAVPGALLAGTGYAFVPDERYIWHGPQSARGIYVWSHGLGTTDARGIQPQPHVRWFNNAGFDIVRFDREARWDLNKDEVAGWLRNGLRQLRASGYRTVIAGGQSRGAWTSLQILDTPGLADVVIAISPAAHGEDAGSVALRQGPELWHIGHDANAPTTRVAFVQFARDPFSDDPEERVDKFRSIIFPRVAAGLIIDRPEGLTGHGGGGTNAFSQRYGPCLLRFTLDSKPPSTC